MHGNRPRAFAARARVWVLAGALAGAAIAVLTAPAVAGAAGPLTFPAFVSRIEQARRYAEAPASLETSARATALADNVEALLPVTLPVQDGTRTIDAGLGGVDAVLRDLRNARTPTARRSAVEDLQATLTALRAAVGSEASKAAIDPSDPRALGELVGALPRSSTVAQDTLNSWIEKALDWIAKLLGSLGPTGAPAAGVNRATMLLVLIVPVALALLVLGRALIARRRRATAGRSAAELPAGVEAGPAVAAAADLPVDALGYARGLAAAGAHREAVRALYGGAARHLVETGAVTRMRTRTNLEMLRDVTAAAPDLAGAFASLTDVFERTWYGHAEPGGAGFERARAQYERVVTESSPDRGAASPTETAPAGGDAS
jgi:hypothetical protein